LFVELGVLVVFEQNIKAGYDNRKSYEIKHFGRVAEWQTLGI
jgi:hypothetical protein